MGKNSYTFYNGITRSESYNEFLSQKIPHALGRAISVNPIPETSQKTGLMPANNDWKISSWSDAFRPSPQRYASKGIQYDHDITNQETLPREISQTELRQAGFFEKTIAIINAIKG